LILLDLDPKDNTARFYLNFEKNGNKSIQKGNRSTLNELFLKKLAFFAV
jgi:hypothetical protein